MSPELPRFADHFLIELLSTSRQAETWRAQPVATPGRDVVLKRAIPSTAEDAALRGRFLREIDAAMAARHPGLARGLQAGEALGLPYFVREYVSGQPLSALRDRCVRAGRGFPLSSVARIGADIAATLASLHEAGAVLQDLHPGNVVVADDGRARIVDQGALVYPGKERAASFRAFVPAYAAPEQIAGAEPHASADLYALGRALAELFLGCRLSNEGDVATAIAALPAGEGAIVRGLLAPSPGARPAPSGLVAERLAAIAAGREGVAGLVGDEPMGSISSAERSSS